MPACIGLTKMGYRYVHCKSECWPRRSSYSLWAEVLGFITPMFLHSTGHRWCPNVQRLSCRLLCRCMPAYYSHTPFCVSFLLGEAILHTRIVRKILHSFNDLDQFKNAIHVSEHSYLTKRSKYFVFNRFSSCSVFLNFSKLPLLCSRERRGLHSGLQRNALASLVHLATYTTKWTRNASALHWRPVRRPTLFRSIV